MSTKNDERRKQAVCDDLLQMLRLCKGVLTNTLTEEQSRKLALRDIGLRLQMDSRNREALEACLVRVQSLLAGRSGEPDDERSSLIREVQYFLDYLKPEDEKMMGDAYKFVSHHSSIQRAKQEGPVWRQIFGLACGIHPDSVYHYFHPPQSVDEPHVQMSWDREIGSYPTGSNPYRK